MGERVGAMANSEDKTQAEAEAGAEVDCEAKVEAEQQRRPHRETDWFTALWHLHLHVFAFYGLILVFTQAKLATTLFALLYGWLSLLGVTAGAHRLWAHRSYAASAPLRFFLLLCQTASGTGPALDWALEHRLHHRFHSTDADPFDSRRGLLHAHLLSRCLCRSPDWERLAAAEDAADLQDERLLTLQKRLYWLLLPLLAALWPVSVPVHLWGEDLLAAVFVVGLLRHVVVLHCSWFVSSGLLVWGLRAENNYSRDTNRTFLVNLSFWPQYHYLLPWDYQTGEFGDYASGCTTGLIRAWAALGWAWNLRTVDTDGVRRALAESVSEGGASLLEAVEAEGRRYGDRIAKEHLGHWPAQFF